MAIIMILSQAWITSKYAETLKSICLTSDEYEIEIPTTDINVNADSLQWR